MPVRKASTEKDRVYCKFIIRFWNFAQRRNGAKFFFSIGLCFHQQTNQIVFLCDALCLPGFVVRKKLKHDGTMAQSFFLTWFLKWKKFDETSFIKLRPNPLQYCVPKDFANHFSVLCPFIMKPYGFIKWTAMPLSEHGRLCKGGIAKKGKQDK
jgi:hypothetical protein